MKVTRKSMREEAIKRLSIWKADEYAFELFKADSIIIFERFNNCVVTKDKKIISNDFVVLGAEVPHNILKKIRNLESEYNILVYMVIRTETGFGELYDLIYVGQYEEEWEMDYCLMEDMVTMSYCINETVPEFSEFGTIQLANKEGGLYRIQ
ncbi:MAG: hypothetical protein UIM53_06015 [Acutalibacteraceae bacterium]|nr:hypothetical protein [Acutalibacteraceae bacterium]